MLMAVTEGAGLEAEEEGVTVPARPHHDLAGVGEEMGGMVRRLAFLAVGNDPLEVFPVG